MFYQEKIFLPVTGKWRLDQTGEFTLLIITTSEDFKRVVPL